MAMDYTSDKFKSALAKKLQEGVDQGLYVKTPSGTLAAGPKYQTPKMDAMQGQIADVQAKSNALRPLYQDYDQGMGQKAQAYMQLASNPQVPPDVLAQAAQNMGIDPTQAQSLAAEYESVKQQRSDIRGMPTNGFAASQGGLQVDPNYQGALPPQNMGPQQNGGVPVGGGAASSINSENWGTIDGLDRSGPGLGQMGGQPNPSVYGAGALQQGSASGVVGDIYSGTPGGSDGTPGSVPQGVTTMGGGQQYGLSGAEGAVNTGLQAALQSVDTGISQGAGQLNQGMNSANSTLSDAQARAQRNIDRVMGRATNNLQQYQTGGGNAAQLQADLTGANGQAAQQAAMQTYQQSPGMQYALQQAEKAITRNAAATGGLGGGNMLQALQANAVGMAQQDYNNYFNQVGQTAGQGIQANQIGANLAGNQAQLGSSLDQNMSGQMAGNQMNTAGAIGGMYNQGGNNAANLFTNAAGSLGNMRYNTGVNIGNMTNNTANQMGQMTAQQGANMSNILGTGAQNTANLQNASGQFSAQQMQQLATVLANISQGQGTGQASINNALGQSNAAGIVDSAAGLRTGVNQLVSLAGAAAGMPTGGGNAPIVQGQPTYIAPGA